MAKYQPIICMDFDGVIHSYISGWEGADQINDPPVPGAISFLSYLVRRTLYKVAIFSARAGQEGGIYAMKEWLLKHDLPVSVLSLIDFPTEKPPAFLTVDDRAICFDGDYETLFHKIDNFKVWYKK
jgi:hypothetical protein